MVNHTIKQLSASILKDVLQSSGKVILSSPKRLYEALGVINKAIKDHLTLSISLATTLVGFAGYSVQLNSAIYQGDAAIEAAEVQGDAAIKAAEVQAMTSLLSNGSGVSLKSYVDGINTLIPLREDSESPPIPEEEIHIWLKSNSFSALRDLEGRDKGNFVRFLFESKLLNAKQPVISLSGANLRNIDLEDAWLPDVNWQGAYILDGNLRSTNLSRGNFRGAALRDTDLIGADLTDADFTGADFTGADLTNANLTRANLIGADLDVRRAIQDGANFCNATMPDGTKRSCE